MVTSYHITRYTAHSKETEMSRKGQLAQLHRLQEDERIRAQEEDIKREKKDLMNATWTQSLEESSQNKMLKRKHKEMQRELELTNKSIATLRKNRLRELIMKEELEYEKELNSIGLTIHKERL
uniref:Uncharacterized protein n=1 Tax=Amphimedon queenslandica TaxID=400682 RepID=A0A1X7TM44_AMPQE